MFVALPLVGRRSAVKSIGIERFVRISRLKVGLYIVGAVSATVEDTRHAVRRVWHVAIVADVTSRKVVHKSIGITFGIVTRIVRKSRRDVGSIVTVVASKCIYNTLRCKCVSVFRWVGVYGYNIDSSAKRLSAKHSCRRTFQNFNTLYVVNRNWKICTEVSCVGR